MSEEHGSDLHAESADHFRSEKPASKSMIKGLGTVFIGLAVVGGGIGGAGYWFYNQGQPIQDDGNLPILLPDPSPIKIRPEDPGGMEVPHRETTVYDQLSDVDPDANVVLQELPDMPRAPEVTASPALPKAEDVITDAEKEADTEAETETQKNTNAPASAASLEAPAIQEPALTDAQKALESATKRAAEADASENTPTKTVVAPTGNFRIQLASLREESGAAAEWKRLSTNNKDLLGDFQSFVQRTDIEGKGTFYRLQAGPISDAATAEKLCAELKERSVGCLIVRP